MPEPLDVLDQPQARGLTFEERVAELQQITTHGTATEIASIEYGYGGDAVVLPLEPENALLDDNGQPVEAA